MHFVSPFNLFTQKYEKEEIMNLPNGRIVSFGFNSLNERKLTAAARKDVPKSKEAVPSKHGEVGSYPITDKAHAASAKGFCAMHHGKDSAICKKVNAKADKMLNK